MENDKLDQAIWGLERKFPEYSVRLWVAGKSRICLYTILILFLFAMVISPHKISLLLFYLLNSLYLLSQTFKLLLLVIGAFLYKKEEKDLVIPKELPVYTILLPVYKEDKILGRLVNSISDIDYPQDLLDVKLLIEADDSKTLLALEKIKLPKFFEVIKVPVSYPRTKPKACNYGLQFAKGIYITVYDAEDRPHPQQLKQVVAKFDTLDKQVVCIQARLNYYNREENQLTKLFSIEYALLFDYMLVGLKRLSMPIPLGGTSNHFILDKLKELGSWDAFNVTEDADLGIRLHHKGYTTELIASTTLEEAPLDLKSWIVQRARWIKGHVLTSFLHLKQSHKLKPREVLGIVLCLYMPNLIYLLLPFYLVLSCFIVKLDQAYLFWQINLLLGIILPISYSIFIIIMEKWRDMEFSLILIILYFWLLPVAGIRAGWQLITRPFYWDKTEHGVSKLWKRKPL